MVSSQWFEKYDRPDTDTHFRRQVGIATPEPKIGTYKEFTRDVLPRIKDLGYNTIQLM